MKTWTARIGDRNSGKGPKENPAWWVNDKLKLHRFCGERGFPMPDLLHVWDHPDDLRPSDLEKPLVLKPSVMFSTWGVMLLEPLGDGVWREALRSRELTFEQIIAEQLAAYERCKYKGSYKLMAEELISDEREGVPVPLDYKIWVFYDRAEQIQQISRNGSKAEYVFMDRNFEEIAPDKIVSDWSTIEKGVPLPPSRADEMVRIAENLTKALETPFMRVDMYNGKAGPIIGELTPSPGDAFYGNNYTFSEGYNTELGEKWDHALQRMEAEGIVF